MPRSPLITLPSLTLRLQTQGPQTARQLAEAVGVHQSQVSRTLAGAGDSIVQVGEARRARYALRRLVRTAGVRWPIFRIDASGRAREWAHLESFHGGFRVEWVGDTPAWSEHVIDIDGWVDGVPFFLGDLRPQGFLGRAQARRVSEVLALPVDPTLWGDDDMLVFLQSEGEDLPGDLVLGDAPLRRALARQVSASVAVEEIDRAARYPELAAQAMQAGVPGSSAGGEQPKFLAHLRTSSETSAVLVKFSQSLDTVVGRRWADLLTAEAHALVVLAENDEALEGVRTLDADGRRFLEVPRFDRVGVHGRRGVVSLDVLHAGCVNEMARNWTQAAEQLASLGLITLDTLTAVRRRQIFGELIGNSDMHFGNLGFWFDDSVPFRLAPAYDMLPMLWAPVAGGEIVPRTLVSLPPTPAQAADWTVAAGWAEEFWTRLAVETRLSPEFVTIAEESRAYVVRLREHFASG